MDNEVLIQIDKDVRPLCPDLFFFQNESEFPCEEIKNASNAVRYQSLRMRVASTQLRADEVTKDRLGITNFKSNEKQTDFDSNNEYAYLINGKERNT